MTNILLKQEEYNLRRNAVSVQLQTVAVSLQ